MEEQVPNYTEYDKREQTSRKALVFVIIAILLGVNGLLLWQFFDKKSHLEEVSRTLETTSAERDALSAELQRVKAEYEKVNQENSSLQGQLTSKDEEIKTKMAQIRRLLDSGDAAQLKVARAELERLKYMNQNYLVQVDSLNLANKTLNEQNLALNSTLTSEKTKVNTLTEQNAMLSNKVAIASILKTTGVKYKGNGKEVETAKAGSVQKIKTCFTVLENNVASSGNKDLFVRVLSPDGAVMTTSSETFMVGGQASLYTIRESFEFDNKETNVCVYWDKGANYAKGKYAIEIYCDGNQIGNTVLELK
jgi:predicted negative regulator of RcsB-dependent stress response